MQPVTGQADEAEAETGAARGGREGHRGSGVWVALLAVLAGAALTLAACLGGPPAIADGQIARDFSLPPLANSTHQVALSDYAGQPVIINFCAAWSPPCTAETRLLATFFRLHRGKVLIIGIDSRDSRAAGLRLIRRSKVLYPVAADPAQSVGGLYGIPGTPTTYFLNARHEIMETHLGWLNWHKLARGTEVMDAGT
ncbi:MAG: TlpA family protein disulfide reductase [Streptosporangiaceae bacterium]